SGCSPIAPPMLLDSDAPEYQDATDDPDGFHDRDIPNDHDTSPQQAGISNADSLHSNQFCDKGASKYQFKHFPKLALGAAHTCAILPEGNVECWGTNAAGQLGLGHTFGDTVTTPTPVGLYNTPAKLISAGNANTCVVLINDNIYCWGH